MPLFDKLMSFNPTTSSLEIVFKNVLYQVTSVHVVTDKDVWYRVEHTSDTPLKVLIKADKDILCAHHQYSTLIVHFKRPLMIVEEKEAVKRVELKYVPVMVFPPVKLE